MLPLRLAARGLPRSTSTAAALTSAAAASSTLRSSAPLRSSTGVAQQRYASSKTQHDTRTPLAKSLEKNNVAAMPDLGRAPSASRSLATAAAASSTGIPNPLDSLPPGFEVKQVSDAPAPYAIFTKPLELSGQDDRQYRLIRLANGLEALLVHDPDTDKSSAAMDVRVGHLSDPLQLQGLAHFCEHLLFMGTSKYPRENEYSEYLSNHSGSSNAYTGMENTNYFFDVGHAHLEGALDRFSQFFISPLFDASCTEREIRAVDSEHKKNLQSDAWRAFQLEKSLSDPKHPYSNFGTGNALTLWDEPKGRGMDVREELLKFHDRYYSANTMKLAILGRESLDQLTQMVVEKFSSVRNKGIPAPTFPSSPLGKEQLQTQVFFRSVKDIRLLDVTFPIPDQSPEFRAKPGQFLSHFIGHEGQGSILSHLKLKGWANHLSAGATNGADGFEFFKISVDLTQSGLEHYEDVVASIFKYIHLLKTSTIPEWSYKEVQQLCELAFRFKEKTPPSSYASALSSQMQLPYPREWVLSGPYLTREFDLELIRKTVACLSPETCRITVAAQQLPDGSKTWDQKEKWYGTEFKLTPIPQRLLEPSATSTNFEDLALPGPNSFIPADFEVPDIRAFLEDNFKPAKRPMLLHNSPSGRLWHKKDDQFFMPKANVFMLLRSPLIDATPSNAVKARVFVELVKDALTEYSYDAELAGLGYNIESQADGVGLSVDGYNDKLAVLCRYILEEISRFKVDAKRFDIIKDQVRRGYQNFQLEAPYQHANYYATYLLVERMWTAQEKLRELELLQADDVQRFLPDLLGRLHVEMLTHGNLKPEQSQELMKLAESILGHKPLSPAELVSQRSLILPRGTSHSWTHAVANRENVNSSIEYYCQVGDPTDVALRARLALFAQIANEPAFDQLRTKEQLGYLVFSSVRKSVGSMGFRILVQSERDSRYVEGRIDAFYDTLKGLLEKMTEAEFTAHRDSLINKKLEVPKNLYEESSRFWFHIHSGYYDFLQRDVDVAALRKVTKAEVVQLFNEHIHRDSKTRAKLCVHLRSQVKPVRFGAEAADELKKVGEEAGLAFSEAEFAALRAQQPSVDTVRDYVKAALAATPSVAADKATELLGKLDALALKFPANLAEEEKQADAVAAHETSIADPIVFKAGLSPSKAAQPVRAWEEFAQEPKEEECGYAQKTPVVAKTIAANL